MTARRLARRAADLRRGHRHRRRDARARAAGLEPLRPVAPARLPARGPRPTVGRRPGLDRAHRLLVAQVYSGVAWESVYVGAEARGRGRRPGAARGARSRRPRPSASGPCSPASWRTTRPAWRCTNGSASGRSACSGAWARTRRGRWRDVVLLERRSVDRRGLTGRRNVASRRRVERHDLDRLLATADLERPVLGGVTSRCPRPRPRRRDRMSSPAPAAEARRAVVFTTSPSAVKSSTRTGRAGGPDIGHTGVDARADGDRAHGCRIRPAGSFQDVEWPQRSRRRDGRVRSRRRRTGRSPRHRRTCRRARRDAGSRPTRSGRTGRGTSRNSAGRIRSPMPVDPRTSANSRRDRDLGAGHAALAELLDALLTQTRGCRRTGRTRSA